MITNGARCTREIKSRIIMEKTAFSKKKALFTSKLDLRKKLIKFYFFGIVLYGAKPWTRPKVDQKYLGYFETWCWRTMEIIRTDSVKNEEVLHRVKKERNTPNIT
jgi:hypothetical protein